MFCCGCGLTGCPFCRTPVFCCGTPAPDCPFGRVEFCGDGTVCRGGFCTGWPGRGGFCPCAAGCRFCGACAFRTAASAGLFCPVASVRFRRRLCSLARLICSLRESAVLRGTENCWVSLKFLLFPDGLLFVGLTSLPWDQVCTPKMVAATNRTTTARYTGENTDCARDNTAPPFLRTT